MAWIPSPGATWQSRTTPLQLAEERLSRAQPCAIRVSALKLLAHGVSDEVINRLAGVAMECLRDEQWRVREAALRTIREWGLQAMGDGAVAEAEAKAEKLRQEEIKRNTPMRTYAEAHHKERIKATNINVHTMVRASKWADRGRTLVRRKALVIPTIDATGWRGDGKSRDAGSGRTQELYVVCPKGSRGGDILTVVTADGGEVNVEIPYGIMPGMDFTVVIELPSIESIVLAKRISRRFRALTAAQRKRLRQLATQMDYDVDGMLSRAELSSRLKVDRELLAILKLCGHSADSVLSSLGSRGNISVDDFLEMVSPHATLQEEYMLEKENRLTREKLEQEAQDAQAGVELAWSQVARSMKDEIDYEQAHARELQVVACLADVHPAVRTAACECIASLGLNVADFLPALAGQLADHDWRVRASAVTAVGQTGRRGAGLVGSMLTLLSDADETVRAAAAEAVGQCHAQDGSSEYAARLLRELEPLLTDDHRICREKSAVAVGAVLKTYPVFIYNVTCVKEMACLLADPDSRVRCAAVSGLQMAGTIPPGSSLRESASCPFGGGSSRVREGTAALRKFGWRAAEYVHRAMPDELPELSAPAKTDLFNRPDSEQGVIILNQQHLTTFLTVRREVLAALTALGIAAAAAAAAAARPIYVARLVSLLEKPASEHPVNDEEHEEPIGLSRVRATGRLTAISRARQSLFSSLDDNGDGVVTAAELRLKLSEDKELQRLLIDVLNTATDSNAHGDDDRQREYSARRTSLLWLARGRQARFPPPQYPTDSIAKKMADLAVAMGNGQWYCCPRNHPYYVDRCGFPEEQAECIECGQEIGGSGYALKWNRYAPADTVETIASELVMSEQSSQRIVDSWRGSHEAQMDEEDGESKKAKSYVFDKDTGMYVLQVDEVTGGCAGDSDTATSHLSEESLLLVKLDHESYSDYYSRLGVFLGTGSYSWHYAVGTGADLHFRLKITDFRPPTDCVSQEPSAEELANSSVEMDETPSSGASHTGHRAELAVLGGAMGSGRWYECHKGHPYYIGGCGLPLEIETCPDCASPIGGNRYKSEYNTREMSLRDIKSVAHEIATDSTAVEVRNPYVQPPVSEVPPEDRMLQSILSKLDADGDRRVDLNEFLELLAPIADQDDEEPIISAGIPVGLCIGVAKALGLFGAPRHARILAELCRHPVLGVKQVASQALRQIGAAGIPSSTVARLAAMLRDPEWRKASAADWRIAGALIDTLGLLGSRALSHNSALTEVLLSATAGTKRGWETRSLAAAALGRRGSTLVSDADATAALVQAVQTDLSWDVRREAVIALGRVGPGVAQYAWVVQQLGDRDDSVRAVCTDVLRQMNVTDPWRESKLLMQDLITEVVEAELRPVVSGVLEVTRAAAMRLGGVDVLARRLKSASTMEQKYAGVQAVERMGARAAEHAPLVAQLLVHEDEDLVRAAVLALAAIGPKACDAMDAAGLDQIIISGKEWKTRAEAVKCVRVVAAVCVAQMRLESAGKNNNSADQLATRWASAVAPALADRHEEVRTLAGRALGSLRVKPEAHVEDVVTVLSRADWRCRREACRVLGVIGRRCSLEVEDRDVRKRMLELFQSIDTDGDMELDTNEIKAKLQRDFELQRLLTAIGRTPEYVLEHLEERSGRIKLADFLEIFNPAKEKQRWRIAFHAATAVATYGLVDANFDVREAATAALRGMGKELAINVLTEHIASARDDKEKIGSAEAMVTVLSVAPRQKGIALTRHNDQAAAELGLERAARLLLDSPNWQVRAAGAASLGAAGALAQPFLGELEALCDTIGTLTITGTSNSSSLDGQYFPSLPANSKAGGRVTMWKRGGQDGKRYGGILVYDGGMKPCPRWILARGFEGLTETALRDAVRGNTVHIGNLRGRFEEKESEVREALFEFGHVLGITIRNRRHMEKPSWALATFMSRASAEAAVPRGDGFSARGPARSFWIAKIDTRQVAASTGGMGKTLRAHIAKLELEQSQLDELGWSVQWSTRRNKLSADFRDWRGKPYRWSLKQQPGQRGVLADEQLPIGVSPRGGIGSKAHRPDDLPLGTTGWHWLGCGREEVAVRIQHNRPMEHSMAVVRAARTSVAAIKQALAAEHATTSTAATSASSGYDSAGVDGSGEASKTQGEQPVAADLSVGELAEREAEREAALNRDQVAERLVSIGADVDASLASAGRAALAAWQEASRKSIIRGRGTRQAEASSARSALQRTVRQVAVEGSVTRRWRDEVQIDP